MAAPLCAAILLCAATTPGVTHAQVLHEFFTYTEERAGTGVAPDRPGLPQPGLRLRPDGESSGAGSHLVFRPGGIAVDGRMSTTGLPSENAPAGPAEPVELDMDTRREGVLRYVEVFEPSIAPWKRVGARDAPLGLNGSWTLGIADSTLRSVRVGDSPGQHDTPFIARWTVEGSADTLVPIASVAPEMRVHHVRTSPEASVRFFRDGAGNHFVQVREGGLVAITAGVSAPTRYFDSRLPESSGRSTRPAPAELARDARAVARHLGIDPDRASDATIAATLQEWFLGFSSGALPEASRTGNDFLDIALGRRGVCRHRAFAFVLTAQGLGLDARLVFNEAHAFVEVLIAGDGWRRLDLGGDAEAFEFFGDPDVPLHVPPGEDPAAHDPGAIAAGTPGTSRRTVDDLAQARMEAEREQRARHRSEDTASPAAAGSPASPPERPSNDRSPGGEAPDATPASSAGGGPGTGTTTSSAAIEDTSLRGQQGHDNVADPSFPTSDARQPGAGAADGSDAGVSQSPPGPEDDAAVPPVAGQVQAGPEASGAGAEPGQHAPRSGPQDVVSSRPTRDVRVTLDPPGARATRGSPLEVAGAVVTADGEPIRDASVAIVLRPPGSGGPVEAGLVLGTVRSGTDGRYTATVRIPATLPPGHWTIAADLETNLPRAALPGP